MAKIKLGSVRLLMHQELKEQFMDGINLGTGGITLGASNIDGVNHSSFKALANRDQWKPLVWSITENHMVTTNSVENNNELFFVVKAYANNPQQICFVGQTASTSVDAIIPVNIQTGTKDMVVPINEIKIQIKGDE